MFLATRLTLAFDLDINYLYLWQKCYLATQKGRLQAEKKILFLQNLNKSVINKVITLYVVY